MGTDKHRLKNEQSTPYQRLDWLIDRWCERRALRPLSLLLPVYPGPLAHTDQFGDLLEGLKDVKGLCRKELTEEELNYVIQSANEGEVDLMKICVHLWPSVADLFSR
jgi:hypothetical protein